MYCNKGNEQLHIKYGVIFWHVSCVFLFFFSRTKKKLDQVRQQLKDVKVTDDKAEQLKQQLTDLEKKVRKS